LPWKSAGPHGGTLLFRQTNAVIYISGMLPFEDKLALAEQLASDLRREVPEVSHSDWVAVPEIVKIDLPPEVAD